jgi:hypothetical protein
MECVTPNVIGTGLFFAIVMSLACVLIYYATHVSDIDDENKRLKEQNVDLLRCYNRLYNLISTHGSFNDSWGKRTKDVGANVEEITGYYDTLRKIDTTMDSIKKRSRK